MGRFAARCVLAFVVVAGCAEQPQSEAPGAVLFTRQALGIPPINTLPSLQTTNEDSPLTFSGLGGNAISIADPDSPVLSTQITVTNGVFTTAYAAGVTVTGNGSPTVVISGAISQINIAFDGSRFQPNENFNGSASLQMTTTDPDGNVASRSVGITINPFNDAPVNAVPGTVQAATEDVPFTFALPVNDVDIGTGFVDIVLTSTNNTLITLPTITGLFFGLDAGTGTAEATMAFYGSLASVNAALNGLTITPQLNFIGQSTLTITSRDRGATGAGQPGEDTDVVTFSWAPVNDAPVNTVPGTQSISEEGSRVFAPGTLRVDDVDATNGLVQVTLDGTNGTLTLGNPGVVSFSVGDGTANATMTFSGTLVQLNLALDGTRFTATPNFAGAASLKISTNDLGNSGIGGVKQDVDTVAIGVAGVNDAPAHAVPGAQSSNEDIPKIFSAATGSLITVADVDAASLEMTLTVTNGLLTLGSRNGLAFQAGDGLSDATVTFAGSIAAVNAALSGLTFEPTANFYGAAQLTLFTTDQGASGTGGALTDSDVISLTVSSVNDAPDALNDAITVAEDAAPTSLSPLGNDLTAPDVGESLTIVAVSAPARGTATISGSNLIYQPQPNFQGVDTFTYTVSDGTTSDGTPRTDTATVTVTVTSVNDNPTTSPDSVTVLQNAGATTISVLSNDSVSPDVGESLTVTLVSVPPNGLAALIAGGSAVSYTPNPGFAGNDSFVYTVSDGNGGTATALVTITVTAVNTRPVNSLPVPQQTVEDTQLAFSVVVGNAITVADANSPTLTVQVQVSNGTVALGSNTNLTVTGEGTPTVTLQGTLSALNAGLNNARYQPALNYNGPATLTVTSTDSNGENDVDTLTLTVIAVNDTPNNTVPVGPQPVTEDTPTTFTTIIVGDVDVGGSSIQVSLVADNGTLLTLAQLSGLSFFPGDGTADAAMTFTGTVTSVNAALNG